MSMSLRGKRCPVCEEWYADWATRCPVCGVALEHGDEAATETDTGPDELGSGPDELGADADDLDAGVGGGPDRGIGANASADGAAGAGRARRLDDVDIAALPEEEQLVYELASWSLTMRAELAAALAEAEVPHAWDGTDLLVHLDDEREVDAITERIEIEFGYASADSAPTEPVDLGSPWPEGTELLEYDVGPWSSSLRSALLGQLDLAGVPRRLQGSTVIVRAEDEAAVEAAIDRVTEVAALGSTADLDEAALESEGDDPAVDSPAAAMSDLFLAADRLQHDPDDREGLRLLTGALDGLDADVPPFGVDAGAWQQVTAAAEALADAIIGEAEDEPGEDADEALVDEDADDERVGDEAAAEAIAEDEDAGGDELDAEVAADELDEGLVVTRARRLRVLLRPLV